MTAIFKTVILPYFYISVKYYHILRKFSMLLQSGTITKIVQQN